MLDLSDLISVIDVYLNKESFSGTFLQLKRQVRHVRQVPTYRGKGGGLFCLKIEKSALCLKTNALIVFIFDISHSHLEYYFNST